MDLTPTISRFDDFYKNQTPPWVIGEPQPAIVELERSGLIAGRVLDVGCGAGEHTILLAAAGYDVLGVDGAPTAVEQARRNAADRGVDARFSPTHCTWPVPRATTRWSTARCSTSSMTVTAPRMSAACTTPPAPGSVVHVLALSDAGRGFGPEVSERTIRDAFGAGWDVESLTTTTYRGLVTEVHADALGLAVGAVVDEPAWLVRVRRR